MWHRNGNLLIEWIIKSSFFLRNCYACVSRYGLEIVISSLNDSSYHLGIVTVCYVGVEIWHMDIVIQSLKWFIDYYVNVTNWYVLQKYMRGIL